MTIPLRQLPTMSQRDIYFFTHPDKWELWPFLPVIRRTPGKEEEYGVLYDCRHVNGRMGYSATVFLCNVFLMPQTEPEFLALPREVFETAEEMAAAGWTVD